MSGMMRDSKIARGHWVDEPDIQRIRQVEKRDTQQLLTEYLEDQEDDFLRTLRS